MPKQTKRSDTIKFLTQDELKRLLAAIDDKRDKAIFLIAYRHGLRVSEVGKLRVTDVDLKERKIMVHRLKGSYSGQHPMQDDEVKIVRSYLKTRTIESPLLFPSKQRNPLDRTVLHRLMRYYGEQAGIPPDKQHFHTLKHSIATHLLDAGADLRFVQDWLGHANISNTVIYTYLTSTVREQKARTLFMKLPRF